jgi:hypothetical protein
LYLQTTVQVLALLILLGLFFPSIASGDYLPAPAAIGTGAQFTWSDVKSKSLKIVLEYQDGEGQWQQADLGSGFLISSDGLFVTAYHVMQYCLAGDKEVSRFSQPLDCSAPKRRVRYRARNGDREFDLEILSHLREQDSTQGKNFHTPDEIIKQRDFVIGKLRVEAGMRFDYWPLPDFKPGTISLSNPRADFELKPLLPPKRVFAVGYPRDRGLVVTDGFINLQDQNNRGYFAADYRLYGAGYLKRQGIAPDTRWGMRVENHMSGGAVVDAAGTVVGVIVNGNSNTAGILSIENVLETFFSRAAEAGAEPAVRLMPTATPLYLRANPPDVPFSALTLEAAE